MEIRDTVVLATICFIGMISPGPDFLLVTKNSLIYSKKEALLTALGIVMGCLVHATYCVLGLALIITKSVLLFSMIKYAGACYLIYLGIKSFTSKANTKEFKVDTTAKSSLTSRQAFLQGFFCNVLNPKLAVFLLSLFTQFITINASFSQKGLVASIFFLEAAIYWPTLVFIFQTTLIKEFFANFQIILDRVFGILLIGLGVRVALEANE